MSARRALIAAVSVRLSASIDDPTTIALKVAVVRRRPLNPARFALGQTTWLAALPTPAFARATETLRPPEQSRSKSGRAGTGAPPRT